MLSPHHRWQPSYIKVQLLEVKISLVSDEYHCYFVVRVAFCFVQPFPDIVEAFSIGDIIDEDHPDGASVVWPRDRFKGLLTSLCYHWSYRIPNLQFNLFIIGSNNFGPELDPDGSVMVELELLLQELEQDAGLPDAWIFTIVLVSPITISLNR